MIEQPEGVGHPNYFAVQICPIHPFMRRDARQGRVLVWFPRQQLVQLVVRLARFAQVLDVVVGLAAVDVVNCLRGPSAVADGKDGTVHLDIHMFTTQVQTNLRVATILYLALRCLVRPAVPQPAQLGIVSVVSLQVEQQLLLLPFCQSCPVHNSSFFGKKLSEINQ